MQKGGGERFEGPARGSSYRVQKAAGEGGEGREGRGGSALPANFHLNGVDVIHVCLELEKL